MKMSALLSRNASSRPGITGTARVDRDIDRLLRRINPGDIVVLDALDLDRITADALVEAGVTAVVNASPSISGRYPNLGPEVLVANGVTLIDDTGDEVFKKVKDGARVRLHEGGVYSGDRRLILGAERTDHEIHELMHEAKSGLSLRMNSIVLPAKASRCATSPLFASCISSWISWSVRSAPRIRRRSPE